MNRSFGIIAIAVTAIWALIVAWMVATLWPIAGLLIVTHLTCLLGPGILLRDRRRAMTREICDWLGEDVEARKIADQRNDCNYVRVARRRPVIVLPARALPAARPRTEIVIDDLGAR